MIGKKLIYLNKINIELVVRPSLSWDPCSRPKSVMRHFVWTNFLFVLKNCQNLILAFSLSSFASKFQSLACLAVITAHMKMFTFTPSVSINLIYQVQSNSISLKNGVHRPFFYFSCISNISRQPQEPSICIEECIRTYPKRSTRAGVQLNKCPADLVSAMLDMVQKQQANPNHDASQSTCSGSRPIQDQVSEAEPTVASVAGKVQPPAPLTDAVAPMPEKVQPAAAEQPLVMLGSLERASLKAVAENANKKSKKKAVGEMLADLKKAYGADNVIRKAARAKPETETETSSKKKKPEEIKETKPIKKRKADESSKKKEIQVGKKEEKVKTEKEKPNKSKESKKKQKTENHTEKGVVIAQIEKTQQKAKKPVEKDKAKKPAVKMDKKNYTSRA